MKRVLFVCVGNSCRSQMAEALARHFANDVIEAASAGTHPLGCVAELTREVLRERGVASQGQYSKGLEEAGIDEAELVVNMSGRPLEWAGCEVVEWAVEDPYGDSVATYRRICDDVEARVKELGEELRKEEAKSE
jgi:protein-tyrosine-phosphatase